MNGAGIADIMDDFKKNNRDQFLLNIKAKIKSIINCSDISHLRYTNSGEKDKLDKILLLHNVVNSLKIKDNNIYFPFDKMKNKSWTLKHIFAQNSDELREEDFESWLNNHLSFFQSKPEDPAVSEIINSINKPLLSNTKKIEKEEFQECFQKVTSYIQEEINSIDVTEFSQNEQEEDSESKIAAEDEYN